MHSAPRTPRIGSVSHGTLRAEDLIPTFLDTLGTLGGSDAVSAACRSAVFPSHVNVPEGPAPNYGYTWSDAESPETRAYLESDDAADDIRQLVDALNELAPAYVYFGTHAGDGSDYGYWPSWDSIEYDAITVEEYRKDAERYSEGYTGGILRVSDLSDIPWSYVGAVLLVNDHGNATCYSRSRASFGSSGDDRHLVELWSCV